MRYFIFIGFFAISIATIAQQSDFDTVDFNQAEHNAYMLEGEELYNLPILVHRLTYQLDTDVARFRAIYYWVTHNISGDDDLLEINNRKRLKLQHKPSALKEWNTRFSQEVFSKLLEDKKTLCTGYAYLIKKMATLAGIECVIVNGVDLMNTSKRKDKQVANHSWNAVLLNGKWYLCDATWSSGYTDVSKGLFIFDYDNRYFLMEPSDFAKTHKPLSHSLKEMK